MNLLRWPCSTKFLATTLQRGFRAVDLRRLFMIYGCSYLRNVVDEMGVVLCVEHKTDSPRKYQWFWLKVTSRIFEVMLGSSYSVNILHMKHGIIVLSYTGFELKVRDPIS